MQYYFNKIFTSLMNYNVLVYLYIVMSLKNPYVSTQKYIIIFPKVNIYVLLYFKHRTLTFFFYTLSAWHFYEWENWRSCIRPGQGNSNRISELVARIQRANWHERILAIVRDNPLPSNTRVNRLILPSSIKKQADEASKWVLGEFRGN